MTVYNSASGGCPGEVRIGTVWPGSDFNDAEGVIKGTAARAIRNNPAPTRTAPMAGAALTGRCDTFEVMAAATAASEFSEADNGLKPQPPANEVVE